MLSVGGRQFIAVKCGLVIAASGKEGKRRRQPGVIGEVALSLELQLESTTSTQKHLPISAQLLGTPLHNPPPRMVSKKADTASTLITTKAPDTPLSVQLHPLVLLTISDYITRHASRQQEGVIVGAIIGQQNGRNFTLEQAFELHTVDQGGDVKLDAEWFGERLEQYRDVHKAPALDLVGMFMMGAVAGPNEAHLAVVKQVQQLIGTDSTMLLLFHPEMVDSLQGGKLPITLYESVTEAQGEGAEAETKFRELRFEVETGEAEMISVDYVATGAGNATAVAPSDTSATGGAESSKGADAKQTKGKGKAKAKEEETNGTDEASVLSAEDEELIASLTAKANAIKMLNQRINLIRQYLTTLPSSYLTNADSTDVPSPDSTNHALLRSINAMLSRLPLLHPPEAPLSAEIEQLSPEERQRAGQCQQNSSVHLTSLLASVTRSLTEAHAMSSKFAVLQREKNAKSSGAGNNAFGGGDRAPMKLVGFGEDGGFGGDGGGRF